MLKWILLRIAAKEGKEGNVFSILLFRTVGNSYQYRLRQFCVRPQGGRLNQCVVLCWPEKLSYCFEEHFHIGLSFKKHSLRSSQGPFSSYPLVKGCGGGDPSASALLLKPFNFCHSWQGKSLMLKINPPSIICLC